MKTASFTSLLKKLRPRVAVDPERDWLIVLFTGGALLVAIGFWNVWFFNATVRNVARTEPVENVPVVDIDALEAVNAIFEQRAVEEAAYISGEYSFSDPSQ